MDVSAILATAGIVSSIGMGLYLRAVTSRETRGRDDAQAFAALVRDVQANAERLAKMEARVESQAPLFTAMQSRVIDLLHHPDPKSTELDGLLEKLKALTLTPDEQARLETLLAAMRAHPETEAHERQAATALLTLMPLVIEEAKADPAASLLEAKEPVRPTNDLIKAPSTAAEAALVTTASKLDALAAETHTLVHESVNGIPKDKA